MTKKKVCTDSASLERSRLIYYKRFAVAFSYPEGGFFTFFPECKARAVELGAEYDRLFRAKMIWLYGSEYKIENEFQRARDLSDINGFYRAFGLETASDRPDSLPCELEFMHYLIFKRLRALKTGGADAGQKADVCAGAERKFFNEHLHAAAKEIAERIVRESSDRFYTRIAKEFSEFLKSEEEFLGEAKFTRA